MTILTPTMTTSRDVTLFTIDTHGVDSLHGPETWVNGQRKAIPTPAPDKTMLHRGGGGFRWTLSIKYRTL
eukprot:COSAG02_NODE_708_length_18231_cov_53.208416_11_plen_70_part_00